MRDDGFKVGVRLLSPNFFHSMWIHVTYVEDIRITHY